MAAQTVNINVVVEDRRQDRGEVLTGSHTRTNSTGTEASHSGREEPQPETGTGGTAPSGSGSRRDPPQESGSCADRRCKRELALLRRQLDDARAENQALRGRIGEMHDLSLVPRIYASVGTSGERFHFNPHCGNLAQARRTLTKCGTCAR
jgi:hypothetical protein